MSLTVEEIQSRQFRVRFRGFDPKEVDEFLEDVAAALQATQAENEELKNRSELLESELAEYQKQQKSFQQAMMAAQSIADEMKAKSKIEAERILSQSRESARSLVDEAKSKIVGLEREIDRLRALKIQVQDELRQRLQSYLDMIDPGAFTSSTTPPPVAAAVEPPANSAEASEEDLANLYVSIDLPDDTLTDLIADGADETEPTDKTEGVAVLEMAEEEEAPAGDGPAIPDLDGDMVFSLEEPDDEDEAETPTPTKKRDED